ncbi:MAG TPA: hypothetical protein VJ547_10565 [Candidatus Thermoplasmatota archaeon]|nr:hypothetical protein [Candidatus Thermoplasmatota archaeon]
MRKRELERVRRVRRQHVALVGAVAAVAVVAILLFSMYKPPAPITCGAHDVCGPDPMHIHSRLFFYRDSTPVEVPANIGVEGGYYVDHTLDQYLDLREGQQGKLAPLHTHDVSGYIHVEARVTRAFTLGEFFDIWDQPLGPSRTWTFVADAQHQITLTVDGAASSAWSELVLQDNQQIVIRYTTI